MTFETIYIYIYIYRSHRVIVIERITGGYQIEIVHIAGG